MMIELARSGMTMLCVTHEMGFARQVADRIVFMDKGEIVEEAPPEPFFNNPRSERTRAVPQPDPRITETEHAPQSAAAIDPARLNADGVRADARTSYSDATRVCRGRAAAHRLRHAPALAGAKLDAIKARGQLVCGVNTGLAGFALADSTGRWTGIDVDVCRALAAVLFNDAEQGPLRAAQHPAALHRAADGRGRHPLAQHDVDAVARHPAGPQLRGHRSTTTARASWCPRSSA